jgi:hypothetical protein
MVGALTKTGGIVGRVIVRTYLEMPMYREPNHFRELLGIAVENDQSLIILEQQVIRMSVIKRLTLRVKYSASFIRQIDVCGTVQSNARRNPEFVEGLTSLCYSR